MKAVIYREPGRVEYGEIPEKELRAGEVKLAVDACGICGSDVQGYLGRTGRRIPPMVMGHEFCGTVVETGEGVPKEWKGKRVAVYPVDFCGYCDMCQKGDVHLCLNKRAFGVLDVDGALAERINVPVKCCFPLADGVSDGAGALLEPLAVAYRGISHAGNLEGKTAVIIGAGTIGLLALSCCKLKKCGKVIVSDLRQPAWCGRADGGGCGIKSGKGRLPQQDFGRNGWKAGGCSDRSGRRGCDSCPGYGSASFWRERRLDWE